MDAEKRILRVFPRRTRATPTDDLVRVAEGPAFWDEADEVHVSVAFTWDLARAERLAAQWRPVAPVRIGGPATGERSDDFEPGRYLREGYVITSRGCPNRCWFCAVWRREGPVREIPLRDGRNVLDDNLLACSPEHIRAVFSMLARQRRRPEFTGGLEARRLQDWHVEALRALRPRQVFFAYDTPDDLEPLHAAAAKMLAGGFTRASHVLRCYVLCGWKGDSLDAAERRLRATMQAGFTPMAMVWRDAEGNRDPAWTAFSSWWSRPRLIWAKEEGRSVERKRAYVARARSTAAR